MFYFRKTIKNFIKEAAKKNLLIVAAVILLLVIMFMNQISSYKYGAEVYKQNIFVLIVFAISLLIINILAILGLVKNQLFNKVDRHYFFLLPDHVLSSLFFVCLKKSMIFLLLYLQLLFVLPTVYYSFEVDAWQIALFYVVILFAIMFGYLLRIKLFLLQSNLLKQRSYIFYFITAMFLMAGTSLIFKVGEATQSKILAFMLLLALLSIFLFFSICKNKVSYYEYESSEKIEFKVRKNSNFHNSFLNFSGAKIILGKQVIEQQRKYGFISFFVLFPFYLLAFILALISPEFYLLFLLAGIGTTFYANLYTTNKINQEINSDIYKLMPDYENRKALYVILRHALIVFSNSLILSIIASIYTGMVIILLFPLLLFLLDINLSLSDVLLRKKYYLILSPRLLVIIIVVVKGIVASISLIPVFLAIQADNIFKLLSLLCACLVSFLLTILMLKKCN